MYCINYQSKNFTTSECRDTIWTCGSKGQQKKSSSTLAITSPCNSSSTGHLIPLYLSHLPLLYVAMAAQHDKSISKPSSSSSASSHYDSTPIWKINQQAVWLISNYFTSLIWKHNNMSNQSASHLPHPQLHAQYGSTSHGKSVSKLSLVHLQLQHINMLDQPAC